MTEEQIIEFARRTGLRAVVTEAIMLEAIAELGDRFTCRDIVEKIPRDLDPRGMAPSEYLVALWVENFVDRGLLAHLLRGGHAGPAMYARGAAISKTKPLDAKQVSRILVAADPTEPREAVQEDE
jgi:hypothetical protein